MELKELFQLIDLQSQVIDKTHTLIKQNQLEYEKYINGLLNINEAEKTYQLMAENYKSDDKNFHILSIYLLTCLKTYDNYLIKGIDKQIFIDTMKCFTRFIDECKTKTNKMYFDRAWWTFRQTSMKEFRIGELEYELDFENNCISMHIPSDAILTVDNVKKSINNAKEFIKKYYNDFANSDFIISSWLLSPRLKKHLNKNSNILKFQDFFEIISFNEEDNSILEWVFKVNNVDDYTTLKEDTSLQKSIKKDLINGYKIGSAFAKLK